MTTSASNTRRLALGTFGLALLVGGSLSCMTSVRGGALVSLEENAAGEPKRRGGEFVAEGGPGTYDLDDHLASAFTLTTSTRWFGDEENVLVSTGVALLFMVTPGTILDSIAPWAFVRFEGALVSVGTLDESFVYGMFSPGVEGGLAWGFGDLDDAMFVFQVGAGVEYDLRFTGPGSEGLWSLSAGLGLWTDDW